MISGKNNKKFLDYLKSLPLRGDKRCLTGQHLPEWANAYDAVDNYLEKLNQYPAIIGNTIKTGFNDDVIHLNSHLDVLSKFAQIGGILLLDIHPANPWNSEGHIGTAWVQDQETKPNLDELLLLAPNSDAKQNWWNQVYRLIDVLNNLPSDATIIFRPFHEANGKHFWWGYNPKNMDQENKLLRLTDDLRRVFEWEGQKVIWAHSGTAQSWFAPVKWGRPSWVDIVGATVYDNGVVFKDDREYYELLATYKPVLISEIGPTVAENIEQPGNWDSSQITKSLKTKYPKVIGWQAWHGWERNGKWLHVAPSENLNSTMPFTNSWSVNVEDLPKF